MIPNITLQPVNLEDIQRIHMWLEDSEISESWYGLDEYEQPIHIGYSPAQLMYSGDEPPLKHIQSNSRRIFSLYSKEEGHIGEAQLVIEWALQEAQLFILIGRKDLWHHHYGTSALISLLDEAFQNLQLHRIWVDVPEYNNHALTMFNQVGFVLEGHLRATHRKNESWYDSSAMGLLQEEYTRRRARLIQA